MIVLEVRNVEEAWAQGRALLERIGTRQESRAGEVLVSDMPVTTVYQRPTERVLLDPGRDANPFFHLFESLWMLAGWQDGTWLDRFVRDFSERFGEETTGLIWGAYGHRWRQNWEIDQIDTVVERLRRTPEDRRVVIAMWDPQMDMWDPRESEHEPRDLPCNTHIYPRVRWEVAHGSRTAVLDITVCCRSNDIVWGAYGANAVHFSVLLEYLAARIGVGVGRMYQVSNNWHGYSAVLARHPAPSVRLTEYEIEAVVPRPMVTDPQNFDMDLRAFMSDPRRTDYAWRNPWFLEVAQPMWATHRAWRAGDREAALTALSVVHASDWHRAAREWMQRRWDRG